MTDQFYKWLRPDRTTTYQGTKWPVRAKVWTPDETPRLCSSGWHLATHAGIGEHARTGAVLWLAEGRGEIAESKDKVAFTSARILEPIGTLDQRTAVRWAADCAQRTLKHYEARYPNDDRPRKAIQAARRWAKDPNEKNRHAAYAAAYAAYTANAADTAAYAAYNAAYNAAYTAYNAAYTANAANAADTAAYAAYAAAYAAYAAYTAAYNAAYTANAANAANAANTAAYARQKERTWQSNRLLKLIAEANA